MASISCAVSKGDLPLNITWTLNGQTISKNNKMGIVLTNINRKTSIMNIDSVSGIHRGIYHCVATNPAGTANHSAVLEVNGTIQTDIRSACVTFSLKLFPNSFRYPACCKVTKILL